ncbi:MAG: STAS domain-containing protein [Leptonema illini]|jgi:anti-sigma B factor antagonist|nr:STAS domain-containing protein [Leptonema illini]KAB2933199.1 MAG: STAS domain-containing protein [Leptonema illini]
MVKAEMEGNILVIQVEEQRVDMVIARRFREMLAEQIKEHPRQIILDLTRASYFDSSALGALVAFLKDIRAYGGHLVLCNLSRSLLALLKLSKLDLLFDIKGSIEEAKSYMKSSVTG